MQPAGARSVSVRFNYLADTLDNAMAWARPDFALFNGTNVLPYPEGRSTNFPATVTVKTEPAWLVATGMQAVPQQPRTYREGNYHDLVDKPFFIGRMDFDSTQVAGAWTRLATYPAGALAGRARREALGRHQQDDPRRGGGVPGDAVAALQRDDDLRLVLRRRQRAGAHQLARRDLQPGFIGNPILASITAHEIFHAWNVKRLRPADMVPYRYDRTGADGLALGERRHHRLLRRPRDPARRDHRRRPVPQRHGGEDGHGGRRAADGARGRVALHLDPSDRRQRVLYYQKGSLAGFLLDIMIRDASDNRQSLDDVMRELYRTTYKAGRGFTGAEWWGAVSQGRGRPELRRFQRPVRGWPGAVSVGPGAAARGPSRRLGHRSRAKAGLAASRDSAGGVVVSDVLPGSTAEAAGVRAGDILLSLGDIPITDPELRSQVPRALRQGQRPGPADSGQAGHPDRDAHGEGSVRATGREPLAVDSSASEKAVRIREGIFKGR